jgi:hypothetical protein
MIEHRPSLGQSPTVSPTPRSRSELCWMLLFSVGLSTLLGAAGGWLSIGSFELQILSIIFVGHSPVGWLNVGHGGAASGALLGMVVGVVAWIMVVRVERWKQRCKPYRGQS